MTNKTRIIIGILVVAAIIVAIVGITGNIRNRGKNEKKDELSEFYDYFEQKNETSNNEIENNTTTENNIENSNTQNTAIGREEQEAKKEVANIVDYEQKAIEMAKEKWGISDDDSYDFQTQQKISNTVYEIAVIERYGDRHKLATYTVDVQAGTVTEK